MRNVLLNEMNKPFAAYSLDSEAMARWERMIRVRDAVNGALEEARAEKKLGKSLEADVELTVPAADEFIIGMGPEELADMLIVSKAAVRAGDALAVQVRTAQGGKCERCWKVLSSVGTGSDHPTLCSRCAAVVRKMV